ncbi:MAG TPA: hypothetical protein PK725_16305 [Rhodocyclaceae bacterium]|jgi:hypothetical protein|nr:hypothetical protein [Rhodocyclaceae bacterium]
MLNLTNAEILVLTIQGITALSALVITMACVHAKRRETRTGSKEPHR